MARPNSPPNYEIVLLMDDHHVIKQMRYSELEAILDGVVGLREFSDTESTWVYVEIDRQLRIRALVFFLLYFDESGRADPEWNVPLQQLAKSAGSGPDMGGGPIHLCCRSQCPINWHQKALWDPGMKPGANDFQAIKKAVDENRFRFEIERDEPKPAPKPKEKKGASKKAVKSKEPEIPVLSPDEGANGVMGGLSAEHRVKVARLIRSQRLRIKTLMSQHADELAELNRQSRIEQHALRNEIQGLQQRLEQAKVQNDQLKSKLDERYEQYLALQDQVTETKKKLTKAEENLQAADATAKESNQLAVDRLEAELVILKEQLDRRDVEIFYRDEREDQLKAEIDALKDSLTKAGGQDSVIQRLKDLDVVFVAYHPGAGHVTIPQVDLDRYVANPVAYAARKCFVTEEHYRAWLQHYENPVCQHKMPNGDLCGEVVPRISVPNEFVPGDHNRCRKHKR